MEPETQVVLHMPKGECLGSVSFGCLLRFFFTIPTLLVSLSCNTRTDSILEPTFQVFVCWLVMLNETEGLHCL
jgi:hypothetical protein